MKVDETLKTQLDELKSLSSEEAATWLMQRYPSDCPDHGKAIAFLAHKSWKKSDQTRLAKHYFQRIPFANGKPYEVFASFMSIPDMLRIVREYLPTQKAKLDLLAYYLVPALKKNLKSASDEELVERFVTEVTEQKSSEG